jgi:hypothetical protein
MSIVYTGEVIDENTIELTFKTKARGARQPGFDGFNDGFGGGGGGGVADSIQALRHWQP